MAQDPNNTTIMATDLQDSMLVRPFTIRRTSKDTYDTFTLELLAQSGSRTFDFIPGQFNMLYVYGVGEVPISISGDATDTKVLVHTIREVGTVTRALRKLKTGDTVGVRGPYGTGWPVDQAVGNDVILVTGGIGLAPLRPVVYHLLHNRDQFGRIAILYGARTPEDILYVKQLEGWRGRFDIDALVTVDRAAAGWKGNVGVVTQLIGRTPFDPEHCLVMVCGPEIMMRFTVLELEKRGVKDESIYLSMERNMKCGVGLCGHCQIGSSFVCKHGPVYRTDEMRSVFTKREM